MHTVKHHRSVLNVQKNTQEHPATATWSVSCHLVSNLRHGGASIIEGCQGTAKSLILTKASALRELACVNA